MKNILSLAILAVLAASCNFLDEKLETSISKDMSFKTEKDLLGFTNRAYDPGIINWYTVTPNTKTEGNFMMMGGYWSGFFQNQMGGTQWGCREIKNLSITADASNIYFQQKWDPLYSGISSANFALKMENILTEPSKNAKALFAEARYWRAFCYYYLVRTWGDVPLITEPYESAENLNITNTPSNEIYDQIIKDLIWARDNGGLPDVTYYENKYRVTKGMVNTLLADVYLQSAGFPVQKTENYAKAAEAAKAVIESGIYELIQNIDKEENSAYSQMRTLKKSKEYIYAIEFSQAYRHNESSRFCVPNAYLSKNGAAWAEMWNGYQPSPEFIKLYDPADLRIQNKQFFYNSIDLDIKGENKHFELNEWAPYRWFDIKATLSDGKSDQTIPVYRYSEVLLIAAESIVKSSNSVTDEAAEYLTKVKERAFPDKDRATIKNELMSLSQEKFIEEVWNERHRELVLDYKTWPDIQRTRKIPSATVAGEIEYRDVIGFKNSNGATFEEKHLLCPIPFDEITRNPSLKQNKGY